MSSDQEKLHAEIFALEQRVKQLESECQHLTAAANRADKALFMALMAMTSLFEDLLFCTATLPNTQTDTAKALEFAKQQQIARQRAAETIGQMRQAFTSSE